MKRSRALTGIIPLAICLPCLVPLLIALGIGAGAFSAIGAWFSANSLVLGAAATTALAFAALAGIFYVRRSKAAACDVDEAGTGRLARTARPSELDGR